MSAPAAFLFLLGWTRAAVEGPGAGATAGFPGAITTALPLPP